MFKKLKTMIDELDSFELWVIACAESIDMDSSEAECMESNEASEVYHEMFDKCVEELIKITKGKMLEKNARNMIENKREELKGFMEFQ